MGESTVRTCVGSVSGPGEWNGTVPACEGKKKCEVLETVTTDIACLCISTSLGACS